MNVLSITGNLVRKPEFKEGKTNYCRFSLAVNEFAETHFFEGVCFGKSADFLKLLDKGNRIGITGRLSQSNFEVDGKKRSKVEIIADRVESFTPKPKDEVLPEVKADEVPF